MSSTSSLVANFANSEDGEIVARVLGGDTALFEIIIRRYNQLLYRVTRSILRDDSEAEDVMQEAYVRAYEHLQQFAGRAQFRTWLTRIAVHEALARAERRKRFHSLDAEAPGGGVMNMLASADRNPEQLASNSEMRQLLEQAIAELTDEQRCVFMMRDVEQMSTEEVARILDLTESNVKVRLHRARRALRKIIFAQTGDQLANTFLFPAVRCDRVVAKVFERIGELSL